MKEIIGIYKITSPSGKIYIGQSVNIERRWEEYQKLSCKYQPRLYLSFIEYGVEKHKFEIITTCDVSELNTQERYYQDLFECIGKQGMNLSLTKDKDKCRQLAEDSRLKISIANKGRQFSDESRLKMSLSAKGKIVSEATRQKLSLVHRKRILDTKTGIVYFGVKEAANALGMNKGTLRSKLSGNCKNNTSLIYV
jgi:group I intron endonuclease